jgi:hypothetical protein
MVTDHSPSPQSESVMHTSERVENEDDRVPSRMSSASMTHRDVSRQKGIPANGGKEKQQSRRVDSSIFGRIREVSSGFQNDKLSLV